MKRRFAPVLPLLLLALMALMVWKHRDSGDSKSTGAFASVRPATDPDPIAEFQTWLDERDPATLSVKEIAAAIPMAEARRAQMAHWIQSDPRKAIEHAVSWSEYRALPEQLRSYFERPFNATGALEVVPNCGGHGNLSRIEIDGTSCSASLYGKRLAQGTKNVTPLHGIMLDRHAAVAETVLEVLSPEDASAHSATPLGNPDAGRDFATGEPLGENPVTALAGGKRYLFRSTATIDEVNAKLAELDQSPGPHGGSQLVFEAAKTLDGGSGIEWPPIVQQNIELTTAWTHGSKSVFYIRVDFPDLIGAGTSEAALSSVLNGPVADSIHEISYGKTTLSATVSSDVTRLPEAKAHYLPNDYQSLYVDAIEEYKANHGPDSLSDYTFVGVHFPSIGMHDLDINNQPVVWAGRAWIGGSRQWLQGTIDQGVIIHEFGHNYGLDHASLWQTENGSIIGSGESREYGDPFDIMGSGPDPEGHFHMQGKARLLWLDSTQWEDATTSGSGSRRIYRIDDDATTGALRGVRVNKGPSEYYWIGYRAGIPNNPWLDNGAYVVWQKSGLTRSWLLDMTPNSPDDENDSALAVGRTYSDNAAGVHITPTGTGGSGADAWLDVNVQLGSFPGNQAPSATLDLPAAADARTPVVLSVDATDPNGDPLAYFWDFGDETVSTNSPTVSHSWATGGSYTVTVTVSDMKGGVITESALMVVSDPLATWTLRTSGTTAPLYDITTDGAGTLLAVGADKGTFRISTNGISWTGGDIWVTGDTAYNLHLRSVIHDGSKFIAAGYDYDWGIPAWIGVIYTSPNGTNWTRVHANGPTLIDIAYGNGLYIAVGYNGTIWRSTDAVAWYPVLTGIDRYLNGVSFADGRFVVVGDDGTGFNGVVLTTEDTYVWTNRTATSGLTSEECFRELQHCNDRFLASGWNSALRHSTDGAASFSIASQEDPYIRGFAFGNGIYLAAGVEQGSGYSPTDTDINLISTDGETWTSLTTTPQNNRNAAVFFNDTFITVGDGGSIWQSAAFTAPPEGFAAWQALHFPGSPPLSGPADDFDNDGVPNLGEYATGSDPRDGGSRVDLGAAVASGYFTITVPKAAGVADVSIVVEHSTNLTGWSTAGTTVLEDSASQLVVRVTAPASGGGPDFLRVRFETIE